MKIVFFGTPQFAANILEKLLKQPYEIVGIVTRPDQPKGRSKKLQPSNVKALAQEKCPEIPLYQPYKASTEEFAAELKALNPDIFVVVAYGEIMKTNLLAIPRKKCINVHPSLLPKYRGAAPIQSALFHGDEETGVAIMEMVLKMDAGDLLEVVRTPIGANETFGELEERLCNLAAPALFQVIEKIRLGTLVGVPQDEDQVIFSKKIVAEDRMIHWEQNAEIIHNQIRALSPKPGAYCLVEIKGETKRLVIRKTTRESALHGDPGQTLLLDREHWVIACGKGAISLLEVQLEGKKAMSIQEFLRGFPDQIFMKN